VKDDRCLLIIVCQTLLVLRRRLTRFDSTKMNRTTTSQVKDRLPTGVDYVMLINCSESHVQPT
jgi:hypothetical protein